MTSCSRVAGSNGLSLDAFERDIDRSYPPTYYILVWGWRHLFGSDEFGLRSFSALVRMAAIPLIYLPVARAATRRAAIVAAALVALNPLLIW